MRLAPADPEAPALDLLFARHEAAMHEDTPPESIHMLPRAALKAEGTRFYALTLPDGTAVAMGALKPLGDGAGEIKSMHVLAEHRGAGLSRAVLAQLLEAAREAGMARVSLETGSQAGFAPARALYAAAGFVPCGPFGDYRDDPNSAYMTLAL